MDACCEPADASRYEDVFDTAFAESIARRYRRRGLPRLDRRVLRCMDEIGVDGATVLEIGGGIGELQVELLERGAARSVNLELSGEYESVARDLIAEHDLAGRVTRLVGIDVAERPDAVERADVVVLNRVVCCYPHAERLLVAAAGRARRALVFSHPPRTPLTRLRVGAKNLLHRISGRRFRGYVHRPAVMIDAIRASGFEIPVRRRGVRWNVVGAVRHA